MAFAKRIIRLTFQLSPDNGAFDAKGNDTFTVEGLRTSVTVTKSGAIMNECGLRVFGMPLDVMNKLTILSAPLIDARANNVLIVEAGNEEVGLSVIFQGTLQEAWIDARNMPQVAFIAVARTGLRQALEPIPPTSYKGTIGIALAMQGIATQSGLEFENNGVEGVTSNPYLHGTARDQIRDLAASAPCNYTIDGTKLIIWPLGGSRGGQIPIVAPETGMVGYPLRTQDGFSVTSLFNPSISFGGAIQVQSDITQAVGNWTVFNLVHDLEAETPGGKWFTNVDCHFFGLDR